MCPYAFPFVDGRSASEYEGFRRNVGYKLSEESHLPDDEVRQRVEEVLGFIGLGDYIDRMPSALSGGQRRRVAIARAMAFKPRTLLYDEATTGLDPVTATTVDRWERGITAPDAVKLMEIKMAYGAAVAELFPYLAGL